MFALAGFLTVLYRINNGELSKYKIGSGQSGEVLNGASRDVVPIWSVGDVELLNGWID